MIGKKIFYLATAGFKIIWRLPRAHNLYHSGVRHLFIWRLPETFLAATIQLSSGSQIVIEIMWRLQLQDTSLVVAI